MQTQTPPRQAKPIPKFIPPPVEKGMVVLWYYDAGCTLEDAMPMIVTEISIDSIGGNIMRPNESTFRPESGIRHREDPRAIRPDDRIAGFWDYTPMTKKLFKSFPELFPDKPGIDPVSGMQIAPGDVIVGRDPLTGKPILEPKDAAPKA
jgi:hypothetical protein